MSSVAALRVQIIVQRFMYYTAASAAHDVDPRVMDFYYTTLHCLEGSYTSCNAFTWTFFVSDNIYGFILVFPTAVITPL